MPERNPCVTATTSTLDEVVELRPKYADYRRSVTSRAGLMLPFILFSVVRAAGGGDTLRERLLLPVGLMLLVGVLITLSIVHIRTSVVRLSPGRIDHHALLVRDRTLTTDGHRGIRGVLVPMRQPILPPEIMLVLQSSRDRTTLRLTGGVWTFETLEKIARHARVQVIDREMSGMEIQRRVPKSMPLRYRRPYTFGVGFAIVIVAVVTVGVVGWFAYNDLPPFDDRPPAAATNATVAFQNDVVTTIATALPGTWQPERATFHPCENDDDVKGWERWVDADRESGPQPTDPSFDDLSDSLIALGFHEPDTFSDESIASLSTITDGKAFDDPSTTVKVYVHESGKATLKIHGPCEVADDLGPGG